VAFTRELATLLTAGIPLLSALETLSRQHHGHFRAIVQQLADEVASGADLADAMKKHASYFDELCISIVHVGEHTGALELALTRLADFKEKADQLRSRVITAMVYPAVVCVMGLVAAIFLMTYVVPMLLETLTQAGGRLPAITRFVKAVSDLLIGWWWALIAGLLALIAAIRITLQTRAGRLAADRLVLKVPIIGDLIRKETTSRMAVVLAALLRSGLEFVSAIRITRRTMHNSVFKQAMDDYEQAIIAGADISGPLAASGVFSPMVVQMLAVGQQSGQIEDMLEQLAASYSRQVDTATQRLTALLEPLLIVVLALMVGFIAMAILLPILEISNVL
jgi:type II secretory pathway component PulF